MVTRCNRRNLSTNSVMDDHDSQRMQASATKRSANQDGSMTTDTSTSAALNTSRPRPSQPWINLVQIEGSLCRRGIVAITNPWSEIFGGKICRSVSAQSYFVMITSSKLPCRCLGSATCWTCPNWSATAWMSTVVGEDRSQRSRPNIIYIYTYIFIFKWHLYKTQ